MDDRERDVVQIRAWMRTVMDNRNWSAEHWARVAGTSPTNITRFLKDAMHVPSTQTIAKLSRACGSMPDIAQQVLSLVPADRVVAVTGSTTTARTRPAVSPLFVTDQDVLFVDRYTPPPSVPAYRVVGVCGFERSDNTLGLPSPRLKSVQLPPLSVDL